MERAMHPMFPGRHGQRGISLVEVLVAMTLGLVLTAAVVQIYLSGRRNQVLQESLTGRQETARFAAQAIERDAKMAGFRGCLRDVGNVRNSLVDPTDFLNDYGQFVTGFDAGAGAWTPALPATIADANPVAGTDVLTLRAADDPGNVFLTADMATDASDMVTRDDFAAAPLAPGDIAVITDCGGAAVFQVTGFNAASGDLVHDIGGAFVPGNATKDLDRRFPAGSQVFRVRTTSYFIAPSTNNTGPALWRRDGDTPAIELAEGVENLQVLYGEDTDGNRAPDVYVTADAVGDWQNVVALQVALLVAGVQDRVADEDPRDFDLLGEVVGPFADGRLRRVFNFTVALRNRLT
jgi:type IV pilus assembly protein PilW